MGRGIDTGIDWRIDRGTDQRIGWSLKCVREIGRDISWGIGRWIGRDFDLSSRGIDRNYVRLGIADVIRHKLSWLASHTQGNTHPRPNLGERATSAARCIGIFPGTHDVPFTASSALCFIENQDITRYFSEAGWVRGQTGIIFGLSSVSGSSAVFNCWGIRYVCLWIGWRVGFVYWMRMAGRIEERNHKLGGQSLGVITDPPEWHSGLTTSLSWTKWRVMGIIPKRITSLCGGKDMRREGAALPVFAIWRELAFHWLDCGQQLI